MTEVSSSWMGKHAYRRRLVLWSILTSCVLAGISLIAPILTHAETADDLGAMESTGQHHTPLDAYMEDVYGFEIAHVQEGEGWTYYVLDLVSQTWRSPDEVDRTVWRHWLSVIVPDEISHDTAMLMIGGGSNERGYNENPNSDRLQAALFTQSVVADLGQVPNQPLVFSELGRPTYEDDLIAFTWDKYLRTGDANWLARLPMTKSVVRAMDALQEFCAALEDNPVDLESFMIFGGSKRGWTTWSTAAVDDRVHAISPVVINLLNMIPSFQHHWEAYGFWAPAVKDYVHHNIMEWMGSPEFDRMLEIVEPYHYRDRLTMPKYLVYATGDQFFLPDSTQFYWDDLPGPKHLRYVPNADHGLSGTYASTEIMVFYAAMLQGIPLPELEWELPSADTIIVESPVEPSEVLLWKATNPKTRDFRLDTTGPIWESSPLEAVEGNRHEVTVEAPEEGWTAYLVELSYDLPGIPFPFKQTTPVQVVPDAMPYTFEPPEKPLGGFLSLDVESEESPDEEEEVEDEA